MTQSMAHNQNMRSTNCPFDPPRANRFRISLLPRVVRRAAAAGPAHAEWISRSESIMGTRCSVEIWSDDRAKGEAAITSVFDDMKRIDRLMSTWKEDTEISLVNREGSKHPGEDQ